MSLDHEEKEFISQVCAEDDAARKPRPRRFKDLPEAVPPAGGEVEVFCVPPGYYSGPDGGIAAGEMVFAQDYRTHVTRLQAENARLQAFKTAFENGYAYESIRNERDALKAEVGRLQVNELELAEHAYRLQAELTKAREALEGMVEYFPEGHSDGECFSVERAKAVLAHQSAPAAKGGEFMGNCEACGHDRIVCTCKVKP